jgi:hypothetical protein
MITDPNFFFDKIRIREPFSIARFNDGEMLAIEGAEGSVSRGAQKVDKAVSVYLTESLLPLEDYWVGVPCRTCFPKQRQTFDSMCGNYNTFSATIFTNNSRYKDIHDAMVEALRGREVIWIGGDDQDVRRLPFKISTLLCASSKNCFTQFNDTIHNISEMDVKGKVVMSSCGPMSRAISYFGFKYNQEATFIDIGSFFDPVTRGVTHNYHLDKTGYCKECNSE